MRLAKQHHPDKGGNDEKVTSRKGEGETVESLF